LSFQFGFMPNALGSTFGYFSNKLFSLLLNSFLEELYLTY